MDSGQKTFVTWERIAVTLVGLLIALTAFVGKGIVNEVEAMRNTMGNLNDTLVELKVELAINKSTFNQSLEVMGRKIEESSHFMHELSDRVHRLEEKD